jgi:hypothetical protein
VPLAVSSAHSFIVPSATMTVHPVRLNGLVLGVPQTLFYFDRMQDRIINVVTANSRITAERFRELMMSTGELITDVGSVLDGEAAVKEGLIDELGGLADAIACLYRLIEEREAEENKQSKPQKKAASKKPGSKKNPPTKQDQKKNSTSNRREGAPK